ncbi:MAG: plasmid mobilization relaxosome protein MobC [Halioglobus sp.]|jgi:uncharacterized protein (DUF1778 family)|uniref:plasmid mobilization protein n=1 Tax=Alphaproteobacteria TaxID=28211 RepID=UPI000462709B|nr:plasmid mobilization relaxosome protein MobC [Aurantimonas coralicida]MCC4300218.1 MobC family plasmid mobilization relaxosome protein [Aurantimonas coralicida]
MSERSGTETRRTTAVVGVRMTPDERAVVVAAAEARGIGVSSFARQAVLRAARLPAPKAARRRDIQAQALAPLLTALARIGNNVNQVAAVANSGGGIDRRAVDQASHHLAAVHAAILKLGASDR